MLDFLNNFLIRELGGQCYSKFLGFEFEWGCFSLFVSKGLSYGIVTLGAIFKVPQMIQLHKGTKGFAVSSIYLELLASILFMGKMIHIAEFIAYGETVFLVIQDLIILLMVFHDRGQGLLIPLLLSAFVYAYCFSLPFELLNFLAMGQIPLSVLSKIPQIVSNYNLKSTGNLSIVTSFAYLLGSSARVFTSIKQVGDYLVIATFAVTSILNLVLVSQIFMYRSGKQKKKQ
eukprot:NODE_129_length_18551_cov_0.317039.p6 type:complete len:230 gc:universal NODE_129_length_18551_cov_0.317039:17336-16647(-)